jgi:hypothetical protein
VEPIDLIPKLQQHLGTTEVYHITRFRCDRIKTDGSAQEVEIELLDRGPTVSNRYSVLATSNDGKQVAGNPESDIDVALDFFHWYELDK